MAAISNTYHKQKYNNRVWVDACGARHERNCPGCSQEFGVVEVVWCDCVNEKALFLAAYLLDEYQNSGGKDPIQIKLLNDNIDKAFSKVRTVTRAWDLQPSKSELQLSKSELQLSKSELQLSKSELKPNRFKLQSSKSQLFPSRLKK